MLSQSALSTQFDPRRISGLSVWLNASDVSGLFQLSGGTTAVAADGDPVGFVTNRGSGGAAIQATSGNRPTWKAGIRNGRGVLRLDGSGDSLVIPSLSLDATTTAFVVGQFDSTASPGTLIVEHGTNISSVSGTLFFGTITAPVAVNRTAAPAFKRGINGVSAWLGTSWTIGEFRITAAATGLLSMSYRKDGTAQSSGTELSGGGFASGTITSGRSVTADLFIGSRNQASVFSDGDLGELLIFNRPLSDAEMSYVRLGLARRWAVSVTA